MPSACRVLSENAAGYFPRDPVRGSPPGKNKTRTTHVGTVFQTPSDAGSTPAASIAKALVFIGFSRLAVSRYAPVVWRQKGVYHLPLPLFLPNACCSPAHKYSSSTGDRNAEPESAPL